MAVSGATLCEVGTTNITRLSDYERAIGPNTAALMQVHTSNYRVSGFTKSVPLADLVALGKQRGLPVIKVVGSGAATDSITIQNRRQPLWLKAAELSSKKAYSQAGIGPQDIDLFESHDAFSIMSALSLEANGFADQGQGPRLALEGEILPTGRIPVATRGGLKARGHPVGATGLIATN